MSFLGFSIYKIMSYANSGSCISFTSGCLVISFSCLVVLARTSSTSWIEMVEQTSFFISEFRGKEFSLWPVSVMLAVGFSQMLFFFFLRLRKFAFYIYGLFSLFIMKKTLSFFKCFFCLFWDDCAFFSLSIEGILHWLIFMYWTHLVFLG